MNRNDNILEYVAELYYERGLSQQEIGSIIGASRPTVSRLIEDAKKQGVVKIVIETSVSKNNKLSNKLRKAFNLRDAVVVGSDFDFDKSIDICGKAAAILISAFLEPGMTIGISWGRSVNSFVDAIDDGVFDGINVAQMVGCMTMGNPAIDGFSVAQRLARKMHGTYSSINSPLFVKGNEVYNYLINEPMIHDALLKASKVDVCINGIGSMDDVRNAVHQSGYFDSYNLDRFKDKGAVASFSGRYIGMNGEEIEVENIHSISVPLEDVRKVPLSIVLNATAEKAEATLAVLNGKYADILIVDEALAEKLLESAKK
ncbi:MAG: winged helix-turn-helix transcriptional regulator [Erysipelotrichaceae bacterium]|nr:winged helix-turn-helix transcriptional regulator [Erysipelotrichaceae bacterium]